MKVLFINIPPCIEFQKNIKPNFTKPPIAHIWLAAILEQNNIEAYIYDAFATEYDEEDVFRYIDEIKPDIIGFTVFTIAVYDVIYLCKKIKERFPSIYTLIGGYHTTAAVEDLIYEESIDFACVGEGDFTIVELVCAIEKSSDLSTIKGLVYKENGAVLINEKRLLRTDIDNVPILAYKKLNRYKYKPWWTLSEWDDQVFFSTVTGKGCPMDCIWCSIANTEGLKYRCMSAERVITELTYLSKEMGATHISFDDANLTVYRKRIFEICQGIIVNKINIKWSCASTIIHGDDEEMLQIMKKAGCEVIFFGVETGDEDTLKKLKRTNKKQVKHVIEMCKKIGIKPHCSFILGLPEDTKQTMEETIRFAIELDPESASFSIATPYKGTYIYNDYERKGWLKTKDWRRYGGSAVFETDNYSAQYLETLYKSAHRRFYWRPKFIIRKIQSIKSFNELKTIAFMAKDILLGKISYKTQGKNKK
ncbi:MAG: radical SAM protein [Nitrospirae bacterium]|nr:radical SAM protein [Nitrospirota bacterium]MBF0541164.1 radical SAM protein [Nitrospirota bacterium]